jgi:hypothetical protein
LVISHFLQDYSRKEKLEDLIARFTQNLTATKNIIIGLRKNPEDTKMKRRSGAHLVGPAGPLARLACLPLPWPFTSFWIIPPPSSRINLGPR